MDYETLYGEPDPVRRKRVTAARWRAGAVMGLFSMLAASMLIGGGEYFGAWIIAGLFVALGGISAWQEWKS